jgi:hypothetical protein
VTADNPSGPPAGPAGYSGTPLHRKLGVRPGHRVLCVGAPPAWPIHLLDADGAAELHILAELGAGHADTSAGPRSPADVVLLFCPDAATMVAQLAAAMAATVVSGRCWVAWPKKASKVVTDLTEDVVRDTALKTEWVDVKVCAVDGVWSGLCLMRRTRSAGTTVWAGTKGEGTG